MSPEQAMGDRSVDARADVYALGVVTYEMLTGEPPFRSETVAGLLEKIRTHDPVLPRRANPAIPRDLQNICLKALEKDAAGRCGTAREMADDLRRFLAGEPVHAEPAAYARLIAGKVGQHLRDLESWRSEQIVSADEYHSLLVSMRQVFRFFSSC